MLGQPQTRDHERYLDASVRLFESDKRCIHELRRRGRLANFDRRICCVGETESARVANGVTLFITTEGYMTIDPLG